MFTYLVYYRDTIVYIRVWKTFPRLLYLDERCVVRQLQEKHLAANKLLYMAFVDLEKAFDRVPRDVVLWAMRKLGINEWLVRLVQSMYKDLRSRVRVGSGYSEEFGAKVSVHQGSVLSPLLFIILLEALSMLWSYCMQTT